MNLRLVTLAFLLISVFLAPVFGEKPLDRATPPAVNPGSDSVSDVARPAMQEPAPAVTATATAPSEPTSFTELIGEVQAVRKVALSFKVNGRLDAVPHFAGAAVKANETIATLDPRDFDLTVSQAESALEVAQARLRQLETGSRPEEKRAADENLKQSKANLDNAQADLERNRQLFKAGAVSRQVLDTAEAKAKVTEAQYQALREQKSIVDKGPRVEDKDGARATIRQLESTVKLARLQKEYAGLRAPFPGLIAMRHLDEGAYVTPNSPVYTIVQIDPVIIAVDCPERLLPLLSPGMMASVTIDALPGMSFQGVLERVPAVIDSKTRCARAEIFVPNPESRLKPGMFSRATFAPRAEK